jgi:spore coat protein CotF
MYIVTYKIIAVFVSSNFTLLFFHNYKMPKVKTLISSRLYTYINDHKDIFKLMVQFCITIFAKFLHDLKNNNNFDLIISAYFVAYYSIFGSIF